MCLFYSLKWILCHQMILCSVKQFFVSVAKFFVSVKQFYVSVKQFFVSVKQFFVSAKQFYTSGNSYDSFYVFQREQKKNHRIQYSRNSTFYRWVYYHVDSGAPYELHGTNYMYLYLYFNIRNSIPYSAYELKIIYNA